MQQMMQELLSNHEPCKQVEGIESDVPKYYVNLFIIILIKEYMYILASIINFNRDLKSQHKPFSA